MSTEPNRRILLVDDNPDIHRDFQKILGGSAEDAAAEESFNDVEDALFGDDDASPAEAISGQEKSADFELESALQGQEAYEKVRQSVLGERRFAMAFVDMRMPPGWDGVETIQHLWEADPDIQIVVCTAFADYSWTDMVTKLGRTDRLLILKKPFDAIEVCQLATALTEKWDVTRRERLRMEEVVRAESEARAYAASLETVNRALEQAKLTAEAAAQSRSEFLAQMTGGILSPMSMLVDDAEKIRGQGEVDENWMTMVEGLCRDGHQLSDSLQDVLDLSELETGSLELEDVTVSPRQIAEDVVAALKGRADEKGLELCIEAATGAPESVQSDATYVRRILHHLVLNAVTYTDQGQVNIGIESDPRGAACVRFSVADSGPGLSAEQRARLFDAFCHAHVADADPRDGAGLGLHLSKRMAQALGGDLRVVGDGAGTRFELSLNPALRATAS
jgi:signal transduction histidine kinase